MICVVKMGVVLIEECANYEGKLSDAKTQGCWHIV